MQIFVFCWSNWRDQSGWSVKSSRAGGSAIVISNKTFGNPQVPEGTSLHLSGGHKQDILPKRGEFPEYLLISLNASDSAYPYSCTSRVRISTEESSRRKDNQAAGKAGVGFGSRNKHCCTEKREEGVRRRCGNIPRERRTREGWEKVGNGRKDRGEERSRGRSEETTRARLSLSQGAAPQPSSPAQPFLPPCREAGMPFPTSTILFCPGFPSPALFSPLPSSC